MKYSDEGRYIQDEIKISGLSIWQDTSVPATNGAAIMLDFGSTTVYSMKLMVENIYIEGIYDGITAVALAKLIVGARPGWSSLVTKDGTLVLKM